MEEIKTKFKIHDICRHKYESQSEQSKILYEIISISILITSTSQLTSYDVRQLFCTKSGELWNISMLDKSTILFTEEELIPCHENEINNIFTNNPNIL